MRIRIVKPLTETPEFVARRLGYKPWRNPKTGQKSFIRRTGASFYPRFHLLIKPSKKAVETIFDLHFDARRPMHKKGVRSFEDFESPVVQKEAKRISAEISQNYLK